MQGFTLIELVAVMVIIGVISVIVGRILLQSYQSATTAENISTVDWQGLLVMNRFINDVHSIRSANDITTISASSFVFVNVAGTSMTYQLSGSTLQLNGLTLAKNMTSVAFAYYDKNFSVTATPSNVRYITMTVSLTQNTLTQAFTTMAGTRGMP